MRGADDKQASMFSIVSPEKRIPADHPLRRIKAMADEIVAGAYNLLRICRLLPAPA